MALIKNTDKNIQLSLKLLNNKFLEIKESSHESWIPFALKLDVAGDCYEYEAKRGAVFTLYEINRLIGVPKKLSIHLKKLNFILLKLILG